MLDVTISGGGKVLVKGPVKVNSSGTELTFDPSALPVNMKATSVSCSATLASSGNSSTTFNTSTSVFHLPTPPKGGSVTKQDFKTGALLVRSPGSTTGAFEPIIPYGLYTSFSDYLALNLSVVNYAKETG